MRPVLSSLLPCGALMAASLLAGCAAPSSTPVAPSAAPEAAAISPAAEAAEATAAAANAVVQAAGPSLTSDAAPQALYAQWFAPQTAYTVQAAQALQAATDAYCAGQAPLASARQAFTRTAQQWDRTAAVAIGPQIERRTARLIDFQPLRLPLLQAALRKAPADLAAMEAIGAPAKGLPVTEHLLWSATPAAHSPACHYLQLVVADTVQELQQLQRATEVAAHSDQLDFEATGEFLNQWIGGVDRLRWQAMDKPLRSATATKPAQLTRAPSQGTVASWQAQWSGLRALAVDADKVSIVRLVEARGWMRLAGELRDAVAAVDAAMAGIASPTLDAIAPAGKQLAQLKHLVENDIALALDVTIGFSDADGD